MKGYLMLCTVTVDLPHNDGDEPMASLAKEARFWRVFTGRSTLAPITQAQGPNTDNLRYRRGSIQLLRWTLHTLRCSDHRSYALQFSVRLYGDDILGGTCY